MKRYGIAVCWGAEMKWASMPISNLPINVLKVRRRIRHNRVAEAFVKTTGGIHRWYLQPNGDGTLRLGVLLGSNTRKDFR